MHLIGTLPPRIPDKQGSGDWHASRAGGTRKHKGVDYDAPVGFVLHAPVTGVVTKLGYPYEDDLSFRYVEITDPGGSKYRCFYVKPIVKLGCHVIANQTPIGTVQNVASRAEGMSNHVHFEIQRGSRHVDPRLKSIKRV
ncbi:MAG: M23 family metallopeptidase [Pseudomonadota bacterium]